MRLTYKSFAAYMCKYITKDNMQGDINVPVDSAAAFGLPTPVSHGTAQASAALLYARAVGSAESAHYMLGENYHEALRLVIS